MNTQTLIVDPKVEDDPISITARIGIAEHPAVSISSTAAFPATLLLLAGFAYSICTSIISTAIGDAEKPGGIAHVIAGILLFLLILILMASLVAISPGQTSMHQFFGECIGTVRRIGLVLMSPLTNGKKVSIKVHNFEADKLKVNDSDGNPASIAAAVV